MSEIETEAGGAAPNSAPDVSYFESPSAPGLRMFACGPLRAAMSVKGCARRWREAQLAAGPRAEEMATCRGCATGALHAGARHVRYSKFYGQSICPRCRKGTTRMIHNQRCVSCYNRERELEAGRNARGNAPKVLMQRAPLPRAFRLVLEGSTVRRVMIGVDLGEPMIQVSRTTKGRCEFTRDGAPVPAAQGRLL